MPRWRILDAFCLFYISRLPRHTQPRLPPLPHLSLWTWWNQWNMRTKSYSRLDMPLWYSSDRHAALFIFSQCGCVQSKATLLMYAFALQILICMLVSLPNALLCFLVIALSWCSRIGTTHTHTNITAMIKINRINLHIIYIAHWNSPTDTVALTRILVARFYHYY